jgi:hypothetical protein
MSRPLPFVDFPFDIPSLEMRGKISSAQSQECKKEGKEEGERVGRRGRGGDEEEREDGRMQNSLAIFPSPFKAPCLGALEPALRRRSHACRCRKSIVFEESESRSGRLFNPGQQRRPMPAQR